MNGLCPADSDTIGTALNIFPIFIEWCNSSTHPEKHAVMYTDFAERIHCCEKLLISLHCTYFCIGIGCPTIVIWTVIIQGPGASGDFALQVHLNQKTYLY